MKNSKFNMLYNKIIKESSLNDWIDDKYDEEEMEYATVDCETYEIIKGPQNDPDELLEQLQTKEQNGEWPEMKYGVVQRIKNSGNEWEPVEDIWR